MTTTVKRIGLKAGFLKLQQNKWRQLTTWFNTGDSDDVELVEAYIVQLGVELGVVTKAIDRLADCLAIIKSQINLATIQGKARLLISHNCKKTTSEVLFNTVKTITGAQLGIPLLVYAKGVNVKVDEHTEMKKELLALSKTISFTTDRQVVLNYCCRATVLTCGDSPEALALESFVWKQGVTVLDIASDQVTDLLTRQPNLYCGKSQLFRILLFAKHPKYKDIAYSVRTLSPFIPLLIYVSCKPSEQPATRAYIGHSPEACVSPDIYLKNRLKVTAQQQDMLFFGLMRPLQWAPDLLVGTIISPSPPGPEVPSRNKDLPDFKHDKPVKLQISPAACEGFVTFISISCANLFPRDKKEVGDPFVILASDTLETKPIDKDNGKDSAKNAKAPSKPTLDFKKARSETRHKTMDPKWEHLDSDDKWKFSCSFSTSFTIELHDGKEPKTPTGSVHFGVRDMLSQMPQDDCHIEMTFPIKMPDLSHRNSMSPRFLHKKVAQVSGVVTIHVKWTLPEDKPEPPKASKHFGAPLAASLLTAKKAGHEHVAIKMMRYIEQHGKNLEAQGLFRINANASEIRKMTTIVESGGVLSLEPYKITDVAGLLKKYFKELPTSLFPEEFFPELKQIELDKDYQDWEDVKIFQGIYKKMPIENRVVIKNLIKCLCDVSYWHVINKMDSSNLAIVWAPNILVPKSLVGNDFLEANKIALPVLTFLIDWAYDIFNMDKFEQLWDDEGSCEDMKDYEDEPIADVEAPPDSQTQPSFPDLPLLPNIPSLPSLDFTYK